MGAGFGVFLLLGLPIVTKIRDSADNGAIMAFVSGNVDFANGLVHDQSLVGEIAVFL